MNPSNPNQMQSDSIRKSSNPSIIRSLPGKQKHSNKKSELILKHHSTSSKKHNYLENIGKYHFFRQLWLVLVVKLMEINSNLFSRYSFIWLFQVFSAGFPGAKRIAAQQLRFLLAAGPSLSGRRWRYACRGCHPETSGWRLEMSGGLWRLHPRNLT